MKIEMEWGWRENSVDGLQLGDMRRNYNLLRKRKFEKVLKYKRGLLTHRTGAEQRQYSGKTGLPLSSEATNAKSLGLINFPISHLHAMIHSASLKKIVSNAQNSLK